MKNVRQGLACLQLVDPVDISPTTRLFEIKTPKTFWDCKRISPIVSKYVKLRRQPFHEFLVIIRQGVHLTENPHSLSQTKEGGTVGRDTVSAQRLIIP
jgi:hypothetical protein